MPQYEYTPIRLEIDIPDLVINDTIIKRKIQLFTMIYNQQSKYLVLNWVIKHFADDDGKYGEYLINIIPDKTRESIADNTTLVNSQTGEFIYMDENNEYPEDVYYMGQYDFFNMIAENMSFNIHDMIRQYGQMITW